jgi:hypothetical protein
VGLPQVLLLLEVHLKGPFDGHEGDASLGRTRDMGRVTGQTRAQLGARWVLETSLHPPSVDFHLHAARLVSDTATPPFHGSGAV